MCKCSPSCGGSEGKAVKPADGKPEERAHHCGEHCKCKAEGKEPEGTECGCGRKL